MKIKIIEKTHELDLEDEINEFIAKKGYGYSKKFIFNCNIKKL